MDKMTAPKPGEGVLVQQVKDADTLVLLDPRSGEYFTLEAVAARIWLLCDGERTIHSIAKTLSEEFAASTQEIELDVMELVQELVDAKLVVTAR
jgi:hypothetical protein